MKSKAVFTLIIILIIITSASAVSAGIFEYKHNTTSIKTHEFNFDDKVYFNISDELTGETGVDGHDLCDDVTFEYPSKDGYALSNMLWGAYYIEWWPDDIEDMRNNDDYSEIASEPTLQGYDSYIFKYDDEDEYEVFIDLDNTYILENDGDYEPYDYFTGTFRSLKECRIFIETFEVNDDVIG